MKKYLKAATGTNPTAFGELDHFIAESIFSAAIKQLS
jgi:hypothetical protein